MKYLFIYSQDFYYGNVSSVACLTKPQVKLVEAAINAQLCLSAGDIEGAYASARDNPLEISKEFVDIINIGLQPMAYNFRRGVRAFEAIVAYAKGLKRSDDQGMNYLKACYEEMSGRRQ